MQLGMIGLGRMGAGLVRRLHAGRSRVRRLRRQRGRRRGLAGDGSRPAADLADFVRLLDAAPRRLGHGPGRLHRGDRRRRGGQARGRRHRHRRRQLLLPRRHPTAPSSWRARGIHYVDVGTSGGVFGPRAGLLPDDRRRGRHRGPPRSDLRQLWPRARTPPPARRGAPATRPAEHGYLHCGPHGAGHFVKMVHNGIEYGIMAAYAEGLTILDHADVGRTGQAHDAETSPLRDPRVLPVRHRPRGRRRGVAAGLR